MAHAKSWILLLALALAALIALKMLHRPSNGLVLLDPRSEAAGLQSRPIHEVIRRDVGRGDDYHVQNLLGGPIEVDCALVEARNVASQPALPLRRVVPALSQLRLTELRSIDPAQDAQAAIECGAMIGDPQARPPAGVEYALPLFPGTDFTLDQGFNGAFSHHDAESRYSLDFGVPHSTAIRAARAGVVMQTEEDFRRSGTDPAQFADRANYVRIVHDDGSMALYAHLAAGSVVHSLGDRVAAGDFIGRSGNTGFSTGPHLHFSVQRNVGLALLSIPFTMTGVDPEAVQN